MELAGSLWELQYRWPFMFRVKGTVILRIWWQVLFVLVYTVGVVCLHLYVPYLEMHFNLSLIQVLGVVIGLLLVFRTNTAYDRYWEGRRLWSNMTQNIRTLTRCIWVGVKESDDPKDLIEKTSVINLLVAFAYATKNYLREEYSYDSDGIRELINHIPKFATPSSNAPLDTQLQHQHQTVSIVLSTPQDNTINKSTEVILTPRKLSTSTMNSNNKSDSVKRTVSHVDRRKSSILPNRKSQQQIRQLSFTAHDCVTPTNIPIELSFYIASYITSVSTKNRDLTDPSTMLIMNHALNNLVDCLTGFERILRTPIPLAYSVHLHHSIWLYLLSLPYQIVKELGWWSVPAVVLASFALLGILGIGWEIENPFGYDDNDLPLDDFCQVIQTEVQKIVGHEMPSLDSWISSPLNHPFAPGCMETAAELGTKTTPELRQRLAAGAVKKVPS